MGVSPIVATFPIQPFLLDHDYGRTSTPCRKLRGHFEKGKDRFPTISHGLFMLGFWVFVHQFLLLNGETTKQGCRFVPHTFSETKPQMVPMDLNIGFQGLAAWFRAKPTTLQKTRGSAGPRFERYNISSCSMSNSCFLLACFLGSSWMIRNWGTFFKFAAI